MNGVDTGVSEQKSHLSPGTVPVPGLEHLLFVEPGIYTKSVLKGQQHLIGELNSAQILSPRKPI